MAENSKWYTSLIENGGSITSGLGNLIAGTKGQTNNAGSKAAAAAGGTSPVANSKNAGTGLLIGLGVAGAVVACVILFFAFKKSK